MNSALYPTDLHGWSELLPERVVKAQTPEQKRVPWLVVGAGVTGLACARRLAELCPDDEVLLLDARKVGQGASGRNSGYAVSVSQPGGPYNAARKNEYQRINRINHAGLDILRNHVEDHKIDCQWIDSGFYHVAADQKALNEHKYFADYLRALEVEHELLEREDLNSQLGTNLYQKAIKVQQGALVQPAALVRGLADSLPSNVHLFEQCPVLDVKSGSQVTIELGSTQIIADKVVLAVNYEAGKLGISKQLPVGQHIVWKFYP